ncbi:flagellar basal body P-ring protein FlgI [Hwanghaeella sp. 1Z406]|jgi:flagellar P-ring protein precursor FlgI|uniref:flagellar basal body P-ring protein FlgI n=1 Tax=Hwanghaeella sp. 1Z406 TaxID=3402811 RepID=UPI0026D8621A|tara:strand:- start:48204 stop:49385 length:1182 start_codon:yes stop_codon:yes gene_type:complete
MTRDFTKRSAGYGDLRTRPMARVARFFLAILALILGWALVPAEAAAQSRIKDIVDIEGVRDNMLVGYGLVVGLNGTGDSLDTAVFTRESLVGMLQRMGVNASDSDLDTDNIAAVMVTATLPPFSRQGSRVDVTVSSMGDADSLLGGTLLVTPMLGADGEIYAVSQGTVAVGGFSAQGAAETVVKGVPTSGRISNGAIIEREIPFELAQLNQVKLNLRNPDFTTARRIARAIDAFVGEPTAKATDLSTVQLNIPPSYNGELVELLTDIEQLRVEPDQIARVVIDEQSGVIVMGENVGISTVAVAQGNLTVRITETPQVSQPTPFSNTGTTEVVPRTEVTVDEQEDRRLGLVPGTVELQELVNGLNSLGVGPRDMITILQAIKASGALQAEIEVM